MMRAHQDLAIGEDARGGMCIMQLLNFSLEVCGKKSSSFRRILFSFVVWYARDARTSHSKLSVLIFC